MILSSIEAMNLAIAEGRKGYGFVAPNPAVGCVILDRDRTLISKGFHSRFGEAHAEVEALKGLNTDVLEGAHVYVTLEPCAHQGKTPPCADKLARFPLATVTYGIRDPNPQVNGRGIAALQGAGIVVRSLRETVEADIVAEDQVRGRPNRQRAADARAALLRTEEDLETLIEDFRHNWLTQKPFVALKVASSLDGQMALKTGESQWITNAKSREHAHYLRGIFSAVAVGRRTILIDNPSLNVRNPLFPEKPNKVVVFDPSGEVLKDLKTRSVWKTHAAEDIFVIVRPGIPVVDGIAKEQVIECAWQQERGFDLEPLLKALFQRGIYSLLLEGGAYLYETFLKQKQVQRIYQFQAPVILGAGEGLPWTQGFGISSMADKVRVRSVRTQFFDDDILVSGRIDL